MQSFRKDEFKVLEIQFRSVITHLLVGYVKTLSKINRIGAGFQGESSIAIIFLKKMFLIKYF